MQIFSDLCKNLKVNMNRNQGKGRRDASDNRRKGKNERSLGKERASGKKVIRLKKRPEGVKPKTGKLPRSRPERTATTGEMRLNRFIANSGVCSRREADKYIAAGLVTVNGEPVTEMGVKVKMSDDVRFDGRRLNAEKKVYVLLNKPKDFMTTTQDPHADRTVMDLVKDACDERIYPVGRLDRNTTGVLLLTNDGELSDKLTHPSHKVKKIYQVTLNKPVTKNDVLQIADGVELEDGKIAADAVSFIDPADKTEIGLEIHSGRNRIVRRIFEHLGYKVKKLDRVYFAGLTKKNLPRGRWRILSKKEVQFLKMK
ncbi:23S rRNA pseudouridine2605 synthase [Tangfeifania diversioriginum]|uniref:Pseudouridine synthase n=2 Tax=Tangfeifania diversioriginum TaxID=1168035 RepID=A0A1M6KDW7_9BACT|nr:23S rRNA pseudouridine2605 synthase [Tangfeifania diversioriginum]